MILMEQPNLEEESLHQRAINGEVLLRKGPSAPGSSSTACIPGTVLIGTGAWMGQWP